MNVHSGSGVLVYIVDTQELMLVKDPTLKYNDFGGKLEGMQDTKRCSKLALNAAKELREESRMVFNIDPLYLQTRCRHVDVLNPATGKYFRSYLLRLNKRDVKDACHRFYNTDTAHLPKDYKETSGLRFFPLSQFYEFPGELVRTSSGQIKPLSGRAAKTISAHLAKTHFV